MTSLSLKSVGAVWVRAEQVTCSRFCDLIGDLILTDESDHVSWWGLERRTFIMAMFGNDLGVESEAEDESEGTDESLYSGGDEKDRGGYDCEFVEPPPPAFQTECPICLHILKEPCLISCKCGKKICRECVEQIKEEDKPCPLCNKSDFTYMRDYGQERSLKEFEVWCSNKEKGCDWRGKLGKYEQHLNRDPSPENQLTGCQFVEVKCMHECGKWFERCHISTHQTEQCTERPYSCQYCKDYDSTFEEVTEVHYTECDDYPVNCPNNCQEEPPKRQELESHLENDCPLVNIDCPFQYAGCDAHITRADMPDHMKDNVTHLTLLASVTQSLVKENQQLKEMLKRQTQTLERQNQTLMKFNDRLEATEEEVAKLKLALTKYSGFPKVYQVKQTDEQMFLPEFYTHYNGYKMCLSVCPNGCGDAKGTHVSIFTYLMKGFYDDHLKWPFRGVITIKIVNQAGDHDHIDNTITYSEKTPDRLAGRVTLGERSGGWGKHQFLAHGDLKYNAVNKTQYLKDNHLIIHVMKVELYARHLAHAHVCAGYFQPRAR